MIPDPDPEKCIDLAAALLFTTEPTDRALAGWCGTEWAYPELTELGLLQAPGEAAAAGRVSA